MGRVTTLSLGVWVLGLLDFLNEPRSRPMRIEENFSKMLTIYFILNFEKFSWLLIGLDKFWLRKLRTPSTQHPALKNLEKMLASHWLMKPKCAI